VPKRPGSGSIPSFFDAATLARIESDLAAVVGPIARQLVLRTAQRAANVGELCRALAQQIPSQMDREAFLRAHEVRADTAPAAVPTAGTPIPSANAIDPGVIAQAKEKLAAYIGPIATVVVDRAARRTRSREEFYEALAGEIRQESDRRKFLASLR
jgi:serine/threonine-protein kinase